MGEVLHIHRKISLLSPPRATSGSISPGLLFKMVDFQNPAVIEEDLRVCTSWRSER